MKITEFYIQGATAALEGKMTVIEITTYLNNYFGEKYANEYAKRALAESHVQAFDKIAFASAWSFGESTRVEAWLEIWEEMRSVSDMTK